MSKKFKCDDYKELDQLPAGTKFYRKIDYNTYIGMGPLYIKLICEDYSKRHINNAVDLETGRLCNMYTFTPCFPIKECEA